QTYDLIVSAVRDQDDAGIALDDLLRFMRESGLSITESMRVLVEIGKYSLAASKDVIHHSAVWADQRRQQEEFHEELIQEARRQSIRNDTGCGRHLI
ncbi:hypothetical protein, partial [Actinophytocola sp.]|uniref:hypothetical protein n=1 Tax=Actinophytocola sp. TaxID=1872138 RepID=UPI002D808DB2